MNRPTLYGAHGHGDHSPTLGTSRRELPMRTLNARMWGHTRERSPSTGRAVSDPVALGGCGRPVGTESRVPIYAVDGAWRPAGLATCDNALLCDFCGPRVQAESADRFRWHFEDWAAGGGQLIHLRLAVGHSQGDSLDRLLRVLQGGFAALRKTSEWKTVGIVDWVRVLHVRWSPEHGYHPHYHVTGLVRPGHTVDDTTIDLLQGAWRDSLFHTGFTRVSRRHGLFARMFATGLRALYAWSWADHDEEPGGDYEPGHTVDLDGPSYDPDHGTLALWQVAQAALDGDQRAWRVWQETCRALKGKRVVVASKMLNLLWQAHQADLPVEVDEVDAEPVALVDSRLWERARRHGATQMGLAVGYTEGVPGLASWWATVLRVRIRVETPGHGPPVLSAPELLAAT